MIKFVKQKNLETEKYFMICKFNKLTVNISKISNILLPKDILKTHIY